MSYTTSYYVHYTNILYFYTAGVERKASRWALKNCGSKKLSKIPQAQPFKNAQHQENMWGRQNLKTCHNKKLYSCIGPLYKNNVVIHISKGLFYFKKIITHLYLPLVSLSFSHHQKNVCSFLLFTTSSENCISGEVCPLATKILFSELTLFYSHSSYNTKKNKVVCVKKSCVKNDQFTCSCYMRGKGGMMQSQSRS